MNSSENEYKLVIRTNQYAGNFERELTAYVTGCVGECGTGNDLVEGKIKQMFEGFVDQRPDEHGCYRPVSLGKNPNDLVIFLKNTPIPSALFELAYDRAVEFCNDDDLYEYKTKGVIILSVEVVKTEKTEVSLWKRDK